MDWREMFEEKDCSGDKVLDVWIRDGEVLAYQFLSEGKGSAGDTKQICHGGCNLVPKKPPRRYSFMEAVALMEQGKKMRPLTKGGLVVMLLRSHDTKFAVDGSAAEMGVSYEEAKAEWEEVPDGR